jgi:hypothetical protein
VHEATLSELGDFTMTQELDRPLYVLPFDHRGSFETGMFGWTGALSSEQTVQIGEAKRRSTTVSRLLSGWSAQAERGYPSRWAHDYIRHGTTGLLAALQAVSGKA